jgi:alanine dehydrogenase
MGAKKAIQSDPGLMEGVNTYKGNITYAAVAESQKQKYVNVKDLL